MSGIVSLFPSAFLFRLDFSLFFNCLALLNLTLLIYGSEEFLCVSNLFQYKQNLLSGSIYLQNKSRCLIKLFSLRIVSFLVVMTLHNCSFTLK